MKTKAFYLFALSVLSLGGWLSAGFLLSSRSGSYWPTALAIVAWLAISALALAATRMRHSAWIYAGLLVMAILFLLPFVPARILPTDLPPGLMLWELLPNAAVLIILLLYSGLASGTQQKASPDEGSQTENKQAERAAVVLVLSALTLVCWSSVAFMFGLSLPGPLSWLITLAVVLLSVSVLTLAARKVSHKVWGLAALLILALLFLPASLPVRLPSPLGDPALMLPITLIGVALLLHSGLNLLGARRNTGALENRSSQTRRKYAAALCILALGSLLLAKTLHNWYWFMVWDTTTDSIGYLWIVFLMPVVLLSGVVLSIALPGRTKWAGLLYSLLILALMSGISALAQRVDFRQLTEERAAQITRALEAYHAREGHYPQDLRQLVPRYILSLPEPVIIYGQDWCYDGGEDYYRLGYVYREHWSSPLLIGRTYKTMGEVPDGLPGICDEEISALTQRPDDLSPGKERDAMLNMQIWQQIIVALATMISVGWMSRAIVRMFSRPATHRAVVRQATAIESGLVGGEVPEGSVVFDGWSYRVGARFAGRVRVAIYEDRVAVAGPRVPRGLYEAWIWTQGLLLALVLPALVAAVVTLDWRWLLVAVALFIVSFGVSAGGAGLWPGLGELEASEAGGYFKALEFPRTSVREVDIGKGWSKGGLEVVLFPYKGAVDKMAAGRAVSFFAPDEHGREVRFAIHMYSDEAAREMAAMLAGKSITALT